jgi:hypothetical protein
MLLRGTRVRLRFDSFALREGAEGEVVGSYEREGMAKYIVQFGREEHVLSAGNLESVDVPLPRMPASAFGS